MTTTTNRRGCAAVSTPERIAELWQLFDALLAVMLKIMRAAVEAGEVPRASMLNVVRAFLADQNIAIEATPSSVHFWITSSSFLPLRCPWATETATLSLPPPSTSPTMFARTLFPTSLS